jgi:hypothetical protein
MLKELPLKLQSKQISKHLPGHAAEIFMDKDHQQAPY